MLQKLKQTLFGNKYVYLKGDLTKNPPRVWEIRDPGEKSGEGIENPQAVHASVCSQISCG